MFVAYFTLETFGTTLLHTNHLKRVLSNQTTPETWGKLPFFSFPDGMQYGSNMDKENGSEGRYEYIAGSMLNYRASVVPETKAALEADE